MDAQQFLTAFGLIANAPGGVARLRELVLSLAFRGELCSPSSTPIAQLLGKINQQRASSKRESRRSRSTREQAAPDHHAGPHEIPPNWQWMSFAAVGHAWGQKKPDKRFHYIDVSSIDNKAGALSAKLEVVAPGAAPSRARKIVKRGTLIYSTVRPYLLNVAIIDRDFDLETIASTAFAVVHPWRGVDARYLYHYLRSPFFVSYVESVQIGMAYPAISDEKFFAGLVPLPPTDEQARIVAKVDELMALCDRLEQQQQTRRKLQNALRQTTLTALANAQGPHALHEAWSRLEAGFGQLFSAPEDVGELRQLVLELAVRGHLSASNADDEAASVQLTRIRKLSAQSSIAGRRRKSITYRPVNADEVDYAAPNGWASARLGELVRVLNGRAYAKSELLHKGTPVLRVGNLFTSKDWYYSDLELDADKYCDKGDLLYAWSASFGPFIWDGDKVIFHYHIWKLDLFSEIDLSKQYLHLLLQERTEAIKASGHGLAMSHMTKEKMEQLPLYLPPITEQKRIVQRVEALMCFCDGLEAQLRKSSQLAERYATAAIATLTGTRPTSAEAPMKAPQTTLIAPVRLGKAPRKQDNAPLATLLARHHGELDARELWQRFGGEVDAFYAQLKTEVQAGWIAEPAVAEVRETHAEPAEA